METKINKENPPTVCGAGLVESLERAHEINKIAKEIAIGLPIQEKAAQAIAKRIGSDPLAMAAFSSWIEALQEALEVSIADLAVAQPLATAAELPKELVSLLLNYRLTALNRQAAEITARICAPTKPKERQVTGATALDAFPRKPMPLEDQL
jgi:hypothetical protein